MSDHQNQDHDNSEVGELELLYQKRKARTHSPVHLKKALFDHAKTRKRSASPWFNLNLVQYTKVGAITCCIAIALLVINMQMASQGVLPQYVEANKSYTTITWHELGSEDFVSNNKPARLPSSDISRTQMRIKYEQASSEYASKNMRLKSIEHSYATVLQTDFGMSLLTCEQGLIKISPNVLDLIMKDKQTQSINFDHGQLVKISFDSNGHIVAMQMPKSKQQC